MIRFAESLLQDVRFALRSFRKNPAFASVAVLTLALGIGATTLIFSVTDALLFHVFPYRDAGRLVVFRIHELRPGGYDGDASPPATAFRDFQASARSYENVAGFWHTNLLYSNGQGSQDVNAAWVTPNSFAMLGVPAAAGRGLLPGDTSTCAISYRFWQEQFHGDPKVIGAVLDLNGTGRTVVGVMPPRFQFLGVNIWIPYTFAPGQPRYLSMYAKLKAGVSTASATAEFGAFERHMVQQYPKDFGTVPFTSSVRTLVDDRVGNLKPVLFTLFAAVAMLLLIACSNVANLLLSRATVRQQEMAIRAAVGAARGRLIRQLLIESGILAIAAAGCGCLLASVGLEALAALVPKDAVPAEASIAIHPAALWFAFAIALLTTLLCGLTPAFHAIRSSLGVPATRSTRGGTRLRGTLVALEVALSIVLLAGAGLMTRTFLALTHVDLGFNPSHLLHAQLNLPRGRYQNAAAMQSFLNGVLDRVRRLPGVTAAGVSYEIPPEGNDRLFDFDIIGDPHRERASTMLGASSESHFQTMARALEGGRFFSESDIAAARQALVVNETFARTFFAGRDPVGRQIRFNLDRMRGAPTDPTFEIVGVVSDVRNQGLRRPVAPEAYLPYTLPMVGTGTAGILIRTSGAPLAMVEPVRRQVWAVDPNVVLTREGSMEQSIAESSYAEPRFGLVSIGSFAAIGLALVVAGVFSVMAYSVSIQTREIGIRMALGARQTEILAMVLSRGLTWIGIGAAIGIAASLGLTRFLASQLWGVSATDPRTFVVVTAILAAAGSAACLVPARHAARVDPVTALRYE